MHAHHPTILSTEDHDRLQAMMCTVIGARTPLAALLRRKLGSAVVMHAGDIPPDVVTSGSLVRFQADGGPLLERRLLWQEQRRGGSRNLSLHLPRGLALLGLGIGQSIAYRTNGHRTERLEVDYVVPDYAGDFAPLAPVLPPALAEDWLAPDRARLDDGVA